MYYFNKKTFSSQTFFKTYGQLRIGCYLNPKTNSANWGGYFNFETSLSTAELPTVHGE